VTGEQLLQSCELLLRDARASSDGKVWVPRDGMTCWTYMAAIQDFSVVADEARGPLIGLCAPPSRTLMQYIRIFVDHARKYPAQLHHKGAWIAHAALRNAFPCD
jgi:Rap1a immunity proteins